MQVTIQRTGDADENLTCMVRTCRVESSDFPVGKYEVSKIAKEKVDFVPISQKVKFQIGQTEKVIEIELGARLFHENINQNGNANQNDKIFKMILEKAYPKSTKIIKPKAMITIRKP